MEAKLLTFSLKALELRTDPVLIVAQRANSMMAVSAEPEEESVNLKYPQNGVVHEAAAESAGEHSKQLVAQLP